MTNARAAKALDQRETGDLEAYFDTFNNLIEKNSGEHHSAFMTNDSYDPPCVVSNGVYTKVKITDQAMDFTNIDKSFLTLEVSYEIKLDGFEFPQEDTPEMTTYKDAMNYIFIGFKSGIHAIDTYRIYLNGQQTECTQTDAIYENAVAYFMKSKQEVENRPNMYTPWRNAFNASTSVCGTYIPIYKFKRHNPMRIKFEVAIPFDDFLPLSGFTIYPNCIFGDMEMQLKQQLNKNLVYCQVSPVATWNKFTHYEGNTELKSATDVGLSDDLIYQKTFSQIGDSYMFTYFKGEVSQGDNTYSNEFEIKKIRLTSLSCALLQCRSNINGFKVKDTVKQALTDKYSKEFLIIPAQICKKCDFSQGVSNGGLKCNTTTSMVNASSVCCLFPRTGNDVTVSKNPNLTNLQLMINNKPYPDKSFDTNKAIHTEFILTNSDLDTMWCPQEETTYSLEFQEVDKITDIKTGERKLTVMMPQADNTNYVYNVSTERKGYGEYCDGITADSIPVVLQGSHITNEKINRYLWPDGETMNNSSPMFIIVQDAFWQFDANGKYSKFVTNDKFYADYISGVKSIESRNTEDRIMNEYYDTDDYDYDYENIDLKDNRKRKQQEQNRISFNPINRNEEKTISIPMREYIGLRRNRDKYNHQYYH